MSSIGTMHRHPLDLVGRQVQDNESAKLSEFVAPGIRDDELRQMFEVMEPEPLRQMLFALQGVPGPVMPSGGD